MVDNQTISRIEDELRKYRYGQLNLIGADLSIEINPDIKQVKIPGFYHNDNQKTYGTCRELTECFCTQNDRNFPDMTFVKSIGKDADYFNSGYSTHCFIVAADKKSQISHYSLDGAILIDPSFGKCMDFYESGYSLGCFMYEIPRKNRTDEAVICDHDAIPIYLSDSGEIYMISAQFSERNPLMIITKTRTGKDVPYGLFSDKLTDKISSDDSIREIIYSLRHSRKDVKRMTRWD